MSDPAFSASSEAKLATCVPELQRLFRRVIERRVDCTILVGHRGQKEQEEAFESGHSDKRWPDSKHNSTPSKAVDVAPYPVDWQDRERFCLFAGYVLGVAAEMGISIRYGGDWDGDWLTRDEHLSDLVHFELET